MNFAVFLISLLFAGIEALISWLLLAFEPVARVMDGVPTIVTTGAIFAIGMALTFVLIFIVGSMRVSDDAASFVRDHPGRTVGLGAASIAAVLIVSILGEMLYQANPLPSRSKPQATDICFVMDFSWSMSESADVIENNDLLHIDIDTTNRPANRESFAANEQIDYRVIVSNIGNETAYDIDVLSQNGENWQIASLTPGASETFYTSYAMTVDEAADDFYFVVQASYGRRQGASASEAESVSYELAFLHHAESEGVTWTLYRIVSEMTTRAENLKAAFANVLGQMSDDQRVSVIVYRDHPVLLSDWQALTPDSRREIVQLVDSEEPELQTDFALALAMADDQVAKALSDKRRVAVIMLSDGQDENGNFRSTADSAPRIIENGIQVHTVLISEFDEAETLTLIASETGGRFTTSTADLADLTQTMADAIAEINTAPVDSGSIPDTLITERYVSRKTIINARVLRILILFLLGFFFKLIAVICIGNNRESFAPHLAKAVVIGALSAFWAEFGFVWGLPLLLVICVYWTLLMAQIVTRH